MTNTEDMRNTVANLDKLNTEMSQARDDLEVINFEETLFQWPVSAFPLLQIMFATKEPYDKLWQTALQFTVASDEWMNGESINCYLFFNLVQTGRLVRRLEIIPNLAKNSTFYRYSNRADCSGRIKV